MWGPVSIEIAAKHRAGEKQSDPGRKKWQKVYGVHDFSSRPDSDVHE
jgi:hypothetical protein